MTVDQVDGYMSGAARIAAIIQGRNDKLGVWPWDCPREGVWVAPKRIADLLLPRT